MCNFGSPSPLNSTTVPVTGSYFESETFSGFVIPAFLKACVLAVSKSGA